MHTDSAGSITTDCPQHDLPRPLPEPFDPEAGKKAQQGAGGICLHSHSITGDYETILRLLPEYKGGPPQDGYMLDICKTCLKALPERPYNPGRFYRGRQH